MLWLLALIVGYVLGSLPFAVWIARLHGVDILKAGSGNPGATNVKRCVGKMAGNIVFFLDFFKGFLATLWPLLLLLDGTLIAICGFCGAVIGHSASIFLKFRGGKGVAVSMGGLAALMPVVLVCGMLVWLGLFYWTRFVSLASLGFGATLPMATMLAHKPKPVIWLSFAVMILLFVRHKSNIVRLLNGTETPFKKE